MSGRHPYVTSPSYLVKIVEQFRKSFPPVVVADTLRKLGIAPRNESYVLNTLRYVGLIDQSGNRSDSAISVFSQHDDEAFSGEFGKLVAVAYRDLFDLHGDDPWLLDKDALITFFRTTDQTTDRVGQLQAKTFQILAEFSGRSGVEEASDTVQQASSKPDAGEESREPIQSATDSSLYEAADGDRERSFGIGLTVRIEINLPADGDQATYDRIFGSIRKNLLDA